MNLCSMKFNTASEVTNFVNTTLNSSDQIQQILFITEPLRHYELFYWK